jgi:hypothetical protein
MVFSPRHAGIGPGYRLEVAVRLANSFTWPGLSSARACPSLNYAAEDPRKICDPAFEQLFGMDRARLLPDCRWPKKLASNAPPALSGPGSPKTFRGPYCYKTQKTAEMVLYPLTAS